MLSFPFPFLAESSGPLIFLVKCSSLVVSSIPSKKSLRSGSSEFIQKKVFSRSKISKQVPHHSFTFTGKFDIFFHFFFLGFPWSNKVNFF